MDDFVVRRGHQALPNSTIHDARLTPEALGWLMIQLALPPNARRGYRDLARMREGAGERSVMAAMRCLGEAGYRHVVKTRTSRGRVRSVVVLSDEPIDAETARLEACGKPSHRAAPVAARSDQAKHRETAGGTVLRPTAARSTAARSATAYSLQESKYYSPTGRNTGEPNAHASETAAPVHNPDAPHWLDLLDCHECRRAQLADATRRTQAANDANPDAPARRLPTAPPAGLGEPCIRHGGANF